MKNIVHCLPLIGAVLLAACGGAYTDSSSYQPSTQTSGAGVAVGEPAPGAPAKDEFIKMARGAACADRTNRLYVIDGKQVFWQVAGNCADASYSNHLYGLIPQQLQCTNGDSIAGPRTTCQDESQRALFDTILRNLDKPDLGLGGAHKVEPLTFMPKEGPVAHEQLLNEQYSGLHNAENAVIRDSDALRKLWTGIHQIRMPAPELPKIDFGRQMVLAVAIGPQPNGCYGVGIDSVAVAGDALVVNYKTQRPAADAACTQAVVSPVALVVVDRNEAKVNFKGN